MEYNKNDMELGGAYASDENEIDLIPLIKSYLRYWKVYLGAIVACLILGALYISTTKEKFPVSMTVLFLDQKDKNRSMPQGGDFDIVELAGGLKNVNTDNEIQILKSREVLLKTIKESGIYVDITSHKGLSPQTWYKELPFRISMDDTSLLTLKRSFEFTVSPIGASSYEIEGDVDGQPFESKIDALPATVNTPAGLLLFEPSDGLKEEKAEKYDVKISSPLSLAIYYASKGGLSINRVEKNSSVASLSIKTTHRKRGEDFLNKLVEVYNRERALDKDIVARKTYDFITERIAKIGSELTDTEVRLENAKRKEGVTGYEDLSAVVQSKVTIEKDKMEAQTQLKLINYLLAFVNGNDNKYELIPNTMGVKDMSLSSAIQGYNDLIFRRNRMIEESGLNHPTLKALDKQLALARDNIVQATKAAKQGLEINLSSISQQEKQYAGRITNAPTFERISNDIVRQKEIRSNLYLMLLKKREETSIELASSAESAQVVDHALAAQRAAEPKKSLVILACLLLGLIFPTLAIFLWKLTRTKINSEQDVKDHTKLPILGHVPQHVGSEGGNEIVVKAGRNDQMAEVFRSIRTNIDFITQGKTPAVILCTSTVPGEGKTFVATNLSLSFAALEKKVLIVGMDIRNPQLKRTFGIDNYNKTGLSDVLNDDQLNPLDFVVRSSANSNLCILHAGTVPPNPSELLSRAKLDETIDKLKQHFDYIVLDSAPVGPVVDTIVASRVADMTLYVCRANYTEKSDFEYINYLNEQNKLPNMSLVVNDINEKHTSYGKSYGYGYGYGKRKSEDTKESK